MKTKLFLSSTSTKLPAFSMQYTEPEKLKDFERIEVELRTQLLTVVSPTIAEFF
jgi:hypothetical protein